MKRSNYNDANSFVTYQYYDNTLSSWNTRFTDQTPSGNEGVSLELDSNDNVHIVWVDYANVCISHKIVFFVKCTNYDRVISHSQSSGFQTSHPSLEITIAAGDDPWILVPIFI